MEWLIYYLAFGAVFTFMNSKNVKIPEDVETWIVVIGRTIAWLLWPIYMYGAFRRMGE